MSCDPTRLCAHALGTVAESEVVALRAHVDGCAKCAGELESLRGVVARFAAWPSDVLRPSAALWTRLAQRIAGETGQPPAALSAELGAPEWEAVAAGIACQLLAADDVRGTVSLLVRLAPGAAYPAHVHAGVEELHLLDGELWIDDRKLFAGDYYRAEPGTADTRVWSETGCTCVLITSAHDRLR